MSNISEFMKNTRTQLKITQEQFGEKIGYSRSYVRDIELEKTLPSRRFLERISTKFNISVNNLLSENYILKIIDYYRGHENPGIPFLIGFTQKSIDEIEKHLKGLFVGRHSIFIDGSKCHSMTQLLKAITYEDGNRRKLYKIVKEILLDKDSEIMLVIKNLSLSRMENKHKGGHIRDIFKIMDDAWDFKKVGEKVIGGHKNPKSCLILIDFPSFLEKYYKDIGYYAIPILPNEYL